MGELSLTSEGQRGDYACEQRPLGSGGYADVFSATHKPSGARVALKRLRASVGDESERRMKREIEAMRALAGEPNVMPILDADPASRWYVMPRASGDAFALHGHLREANLVALLVDVCDALTAAHGADYVHRDITPANVLYLDDGDGARWVLADWGLVRAPDGSSASRLTVTSAVVGTQGFIAPEVLRSSGEASAASDVYGLGRVAAWACSGEVPLAGQELLPPGPFRQAIRGATRPQSAARSTLAEFRAAVQAVRFGPPAQPTDTARALLDAALAGDVAAASKLMNLAEENPSDAELYLDFLARLGRGSIMPFVATEPEAAGRIAEAMASHLGDDFGGDFNYLNVPLQFIFDIAAIAAERGELGLLEDAAITLFEVDRSCVRYEQRRRSRSWLEALRGQPAATVARSLRAVPSVVEWYLEEDWRPARTTDPEIRSALVAAEGSTSE